MSNTDIPKIEDFYVNASLYTSFKVTDSDEDREKVMELLFTTNSLDCFCVDCNLQSVFQSVNNRPNKSSGAGGHFHFPITHQKEWSFSLTDGNDVFEKEFICSRNFAHKSSYFIQVKNGLLQKIGQYPALAEIAEQDIKKFKKILGNETYLEFSKAIGLYTHGVGVGAFVYLRRIIENFIISPAYAVAKTKTGWDEEKYQKGRVKEKIDLLKPELPEFLVNNTIIYSIISKGIHELKEEECKKYFPTLKTCLEFVLTDLEAKRETDAKRKEMEITLGKIAGDIK